MDRKMASMGNSRVKEAIRSKKILLKTWELCKLGIEKHKTKPIKKLQ